MSLALGVELDKPTDHDVGPLLPTKLTYNLCACVMSFYITNTKTNHNILT